VGSWRDVLQRDFAETSGQDSDAESWAGDGRGLWGRESEDRGVAPGRGRAGARGVLCLGSDCRVGVERRGGLDKPKPLPGRGEPPQEEGAGVGVCGPSHEPLPH